MSKLAKFLVTLAIMALASNAWAVGKPLAIPFGDSALNPAFVTMQSDRSLDDPGSPVNWATAILNGGNYMKAMQADFTEDNAGNGSGGTESPDDPDDAGWDWSVDADTDPYFHTTNPSATNLYGVSALGLYYAYVKNSYTTSHPWFIAMKDAADRAVAAGTADIRTGSDIKFLMLFNNLSGVSGTAYKDAARAKYDWRITNQGGGTASGFAAWLRDVRGVTQGYPNGIIGWDLGVYAVVAQMLFDRYGAPYDAHADAIAEVLYQDSFNNNPGLFDIDDDDGWDPGWANVNYWWYNLGLTGLLDAFNYSGTHTTEIAGIITRLQASQFSNGAFSGSYGANATDEDWQTTAYVVASLADYNPVAYSAEIAHGAYWTAATQHTSGGWLYGDNSHYPEIAGENLGAMTFGGPADEIWVDDSWSDQDDVDLSPYAGLVWGYDAFNDIQTAINNVGSSTIHVLNGTYYTTLNIYQDLTLIGESQAGVIINASAFNDYGIDASGDYDFVFQNFTLDGPDAAVTGNYGLKVSGDNATAAISNVTVIGTGKTGIDLNGLASGSITNCTSTGALSGNGLSLTDCSNFTINGLTTSGNAWGGAAVYTYGRYNTGGSNNVTFTGTLNISEARPIYWERDLWNLIRPPLTNLTVPVGAYPYVVGNDLYPYLEAFMPSQAAAVAAANLVGVNGWAYDRALDFFHVTPPMRVQAALTASASTFAYEATANEVHMTAGVFEGFSVNGLSNTNVVGVGNSTIVRPTALLSAGIGHKYDAAMNVAVFVNNSTNVTLQSMQIEDGVGITPCGGSGAHAIVFWNSSSGSMSNCNVLGTYTIGGCQTGQGLAVDASAPGSTTLAVNNCTISGFQKNAVDVVDGNGGGAGGGAITFNMTGGTILGEGPTTAIAQNGVLFWSRAGGVVGGTINGVNVSALNYTPAGSEATGINLYNATGTTTVQNCIIDAEYPTYDPLAGHTWNNNCYSDFTSNAGFPAQYNVNGGGGNIDYNPNTSGCTDIGFVLSDNLVGCSGSCDEFYLYLTLAEAGLPNLHVELQLPAGIATTLPVGGAVVDPITNEDANLINAYAIPVGTTVVVDMGFSGSGSTGDYTKYVARIPLVSTATTGTHAVNVLSTLWIDQFNSPHADALTEGAAAIEVDCTVPVITSFSSSATCAFGSAAQMDNKFTATLTDLNSQLDEAWVTFAPSGDSISLFGANLASPETLTFPTSGAQATAFYDALDEGCNTLTLHLTDSECNVATTVDIVNVGRDNTAPVLTATDGLSSCYNAASVVAALESNLDVDVAGLTPLNCRATSGTLTITSVTTPGGTPYTLPLTTDLTDFPGVTYGTALWTWMTTPGQGNVPANADGITYVFNVIVSDCAGNISGTQSFDLCIDLVNPQNAVTVFDARPAHLGVWLKWAWEAGLQAQEMRIYRSPLSGEYPAYPSDLWRFTANYNVSSVPPAGWTLVATQTAVSGPQSADNYTGVNGKGLLNYHAVGADSFWLDAAGSWTDGDGNSASFRDIYRYVTFVKDAGGNWSTGTPVVFNQNADRSTNYWMGDFSTADADGGLDGSRGRVDTDDLGLFSPVYFTNTGTYQNIGPVYFDNGTVGKSIPNPDTLASGVINFSDLVVFSFNYGTVSPVGINATEFGFEPNPALAKPFTNLDEEPVVNISLPSEATFDQGTEFTVTVSMTGNEGGVVKVVEAVLDYDDMLLEYVGSTSSTFSTEGTLFTKSALINNEPGKVGFVAAACGGEATLAESAVLGTVTFRVAREILSACEVSLVSVEMVDNTGNIRSTESESISITSSSAIPDNYALYQNYPNPFNPTTNIQFDLVEAGHVTIQVYNTLGQMVANVLDKPLEAGRHEVSFDASTLASGLYVYTIQVNGFSDLKKMVLIR